jgi:hypothetical protein
MAFLIADGLLIHPRNYFLYKILIQKRLFFILSLYLTGYLCVLLGDNDRPVYQ